MAASATAAEVATAFIAGHQDLFLLDKPDEELLLAEVIRDQAGRTHVELIQQYKGIPVWAHNLVVHLDRDGGIYVINARYSPTPRGLDLKVARISAETAIANALADLSGQMEIRDLDNRIRSLLHYDGPTADLYIWFDRETDKPHLVWHVQIRPNIRDWWYYFIDANTGEVLEQYNNTKFDGPTTGTGVDLLGVNRTLNVYSYGAEYLMVDASRSMWQSVQPNIFNDPRGALWTL
ncbi:PepSY domain-containing protein, partial [Candidatus Zixiibacteriota bacterium]